MVMKPERGGGKTRGRRRIEMRPIQRVNRRQVTFSKRKSGLFKKASEIAVLYGARVAVVAFSGTGRPFALCTGDAAVLLPAGLVEDDSEKVAALVRATEGKSKEVKAEKERMDTVGKVVARAGKPHWWVTELAALGQAELPEFAKALQRLRDNVSCRVDHLLLPAPAPRRRLN